LILSLLGKPNIEVANNPEYQKISSRTEKVIWTSLAMAWYG